MYKPRYVTYTLPRFCSTTLIKLLIAFDVVQIADEALEVVFEGVRINSKVDHFVPHFSDAAGDNPRVQMSAHGVGSAYTL